MKIAIGIFFTVFSIISSKGQGPVDWQFTTKKLGEKKYEIRIKAVIDNGWHIYSQNTPEGGPVPTIVKFSKNPLVELDGTIREVGFLKKKFENVFDVDVHYYDEKVEFVQVVKLKANAKTNLSGTIEYMVCNDEECLPPKTIPFSVAIQ